eukprot:15072_4
MIVLRCLRQFLSLSGVAPPLSRLMRFFLGAPFLFSNQSASDTACFRRLPLSSAWVSAGADVGREYVWLSVLQPQALLSSGPPRQAWGFWMRLSLASAPPLLHIQCISSTAPSPGLFSFAHPPKQRLLLPLP